MSLNITTTTTSTFIEDGSPLLPGSRNLSGNGINPESSDIQLNCSDDDSSENQTAKLGNNMTVPDSLKDILRTMMGLRGSNLPSEASAVKTIDDFQKQTKTGMLSVEQMKEIADTGYLTEKDRHTKLLDIKGRTIPVPQDVQNAAKTFMANNADLFKRVESSTTGKHDGLMGGDDYKNAYKDGCLSTSSSQNNSNNTVQLSGLSQNYFMQAVMQNQLSPTRPSDYNAAKTLDSFLKDNKIDLLSNKQVQEIADTGYLTDNNGNAIQVSPQLQAAAQAMMANNGELFKKLESGYTGKHDGLVGRLDFDSAVKDGSITPGSNGTNNTNGNQQMITINSNGAGIGNTLPSDYSAAKTLDSFLKDNKIDLLSDKQIDEMAKTGYLTDKNGNTTLVSPELQAAAQAMMANNGELFKKLESGYTGKHDGLVGRLDFDAAVKDGSLSAAA